MCKRAAGQVAQLLSWRRVCWPRAVGQGAQLLSWRRHSSCALGKGAGSGWAQQARASSGVERECSVMYFSLCRRLSANFSVFHQLLRMEHGARSA